MKIPRFVVVCPKGVATGGPEALHQLSLSLSESGAESFMWDPDPQRRNSSAVAQYDIYATQWLEAEPVAGDVLVIPEVLSELIPKFYDSNPCIFWWLSVDNFFESEYLPIEVIRDFFPKVIHAYQSEYARAFLDQMKISKSLALSDYLNAEFFASSIVPPVSLRKKGNESLVAINPAKGLERTVQLLERLPEERVIRLENMSASEVSKALQSATYYLDLGHHPGKDRFPREAASQGCIVLTNKRGSAANNTDIPIDSNVFKFDDGDPDFVETIYSRLSELDMDPESFAEKQSGYRNIIQAQRSIFNNEVTILLSHVASVASPTPDYEATAKDSLASALLPLLAKRDALAQERDALAQERDMASRKVLEIKKSLSWKVTSPLRSIDRLLRKRP